MKKLFAVIGLVGIAFGAIGQSAITRNYFTTNAQPINPTFSGINITGTNGTTLSGNLVVNGSISGGGLPINIVSYGASTNSSDNSPAINAAIQASTNNWHSLGRKVVMPPGYFTCLSTITIYPGTWLEGEGDKATTLYFPNAINHCIAYSTNGQDSGAWAIAPITLKGFGVFNPYTTVTNSGDAIHIDASFGSAPALEPFYTRPTLEDLSVRVSCRNGIYLKSVINGTMANCLVSYATNVGIFFDNSMNGFVASACYAQVNKGVGWRLDGVVYSTLNSTASDGNQGGGYIIDTNCAGLVMVGCGAENNWGTAYNFRQTRGVTAIHCTAYQGPNGTNGVTIDNPEQLTLDNCIIGSAVNATNHGFQYFVTPATTIREVILRDYAPDSWGSGSINDVSKLSVFEDWYDNIRIYRDHQGNMVGFTNSVMTSPGAYLTKATYNTLTTPLVVEGAQSSSAGNYVGPKVDFRGNAGMLGLILGRGDPANRNGGQIEIDTMSNTTVTNRAALFTEPGNAELFQSLLVDGNQTNSGTLTVNGATVLNGNTTVTNQGGGTGVFVGTNGQVNVTGGFYINGVPVTTGGSATNAIGNNSGFGTNTTLKGITTADGIVATNFTGNGLLVTNVPATNITTLNASLASSGNVTNYTIDLLPGPSGNLTTIYLANTNAYVTFTGTNQANWHRTVLFRGWTNAINSVIKFASGVRTNQNTSLTVSNGWSAVFNFYNTDTSGTNVLVSDAGRYQ